MKKVNFLKATVALAFAFILFPSLSLAKGEEGIIKVTAKSEVEVVITTKDGEKKVIRKNADEAKVVPGDTVIFSVVFENTGKEEATGVVINNPVPEHMVYIADSAEGKNTTITFSVDKGKNFKLPKDLRVKNKRGKEVGAKPEHYTNIRWTLDNALPSSKKGTVTFRALLK